MAESIEALGLAITDEIKSATVRDGDTIVVTFVRPLVGDEDYQLKESCKVHLPGVNIVALSEVADIRVFRPGGEATDG